MANFLPYDNDPMIFYNFESPDMAPSEFREEMGKFPCHVCEEVGCVSVLC